MMMLRGNLSCSCSNLYRIYFMVNKSNTKILKANILFFHKVIPKEIVVLLLINYILPNAMYIYNIFCPFVKIPLVLSRTCTRTL